MSDKVTVLKVAIPARLARAAVAAMEADCFESVDEWVCDMMRVRIRAILEGDRRTIFTYQPNAVKGDTKSTVQMVADRDELAKFLKEEREVSAVCSAPKAEVGQ